MQHLVVAKEGPVAIVTVNREKALNALSSAVLGELIDVAVQLESEPERKAVVVTGAGDKAFVAGADIAEMQTMEPERAQTLSNRGAALGRAIARSRLIWIAAVNGFALGGGLELAMLCDFIYASERAKFGQPEVKLGVVPGFGGTQRLSRRVGVARAIELCATGDVISAEEALRIGVCDRLFPHDQLMTAAVACGERVAQNGPLAVAAVKRVIRQGADLALDEAVAVESAAFGSMFSTADQREGMAAFLAKRKPSFAAK